MDYATIVNAVPWTPVGLTIVQTLSIYWLLLFGLRALGRRVFGEMGPQDLIILLLISEASNLGMVHQDAGYWGTVASIITILAMGAMTQRVKPIRDFLENSPVILFKNGILNKKAMRRNLILEDELIKTAHEYGLTTYQDFDLIVLESDGNLTGVVKPEARLNQQTASPTVAV